MSKEKFKAFVKDKPHFVDLVNRGEATWQQLYEAYDIYGPDASVWDKYKPKTSGSTEKESADYSNMSLKDLWGNIKNMNMDTVKDNMESLGKAVDFLKDMTSSSTGASETVSSAFKPKNINKLFDD